MDGFDIIDKYFPDLDEGRRSQLHSLGALYSEWNSKINVVSRKDIGLLYERHVLHSLSIAKFIRFQTGTHVMDLGTGGGFPGIPLSIFFPNTYFTLVDSIAKKTLVVQDIVSRIALTNVQVLTSRVENVRQDFDFVVSRATAPLGDLQRWSAKNISKKQLNAIPNGIICLKGGDLKEELEPFKNRVEVVDLTDFFKKNQEVLAESSHGVKPVETGRRAPCHSSFKKENPVAQESHSRKRRQKKQAEVFFLVLLIIITAVLVFVFT